MNEIIKNIEAAQMKAEVPQFNVGDTVRVHGKIKEGNRERIQVFEGVVLKKQGGSSRETFTVRKNSNGIGVEKTWPLHSPNVEKVEVIRRGKVRRRPCPAYRCRSSFVVPDDTRSTWAQPWGTWHRSARLPRTDTIRAFLRAAYPVPEAAYRQSGK